MTMILVALPLIRVCGLLGLFPSGGRSVKACGILLCYLGRGLGAGDVAVWPYSVGMLVKNASSSGCLH